MLGWTCLQLLEIPAESVDEAIEDDVPKQALIELIVAQQAKIIQAATGATGHRLRKRYKEILRFIENVRTEWKSDYFVYNSNRCVHDASFGHSPPAKSSPESQCRLTSAFTRVASQVHRVESSRDHCY